MRWTPIDSSKWPLIYILGDAFVLQAPGEILGKKCRLLSHHVVQARKIRRGLRPEVSGHSLKGFRACPQRLSAPRSLQKAQFCP